MILNLLLSALISKGVQGPPQERTLFQTHQPYSDRINSRADVAVIYGIDKTMPDRIKSWRDRGYRVHLMTGVSWGDYQDYYYGRFDGISHEDEAQTRANGSKIGHGGDVYYMSPGKNYGKFLAVGVQKALEAGVEAVHLEEPEFWVGGGYGEGFKREWQDYYHQPWQDPSGSPDARWRAAKLMYFLYRRALQQVFDSIQAFNKAHGTSVHCYVPTHSLLNYASWGIVSPESSLSRLNGCDGYIAQVWTGTARTPNYYQGLKKERTFETAYLEYGSMQNLVRSTGRKVWYLADPIEDNPDHDWGDYRRNYESTLVASLLHPEVSQYEVMPWPERIFNGDYPSEADPKHRVPIPAPYQTELQTVFNALKDMNQGAVKWETGAGQVGVMVSDSLMFQRGGPNSSDDEMGHFYGLALPFVKLGIPVQPVQLENVTIPRYLADFKLILMSYEGMKPLNPEVHKPIADWVKAGGTLVFVDNDKDPFLKVQEWWNTSPMSFDTPRKHLFELMGLPADFSQESSQVGKGRLIFLRESPTEISRSEKGALNLRERIESNLPKYRREEGNSFILRRGPYVVATGMDETMGPAKPLRGSFINLFDPQLRVLNRVDVTPGSRYLLVDLDRHRLPVVAAAGKVTTVVSSAHRWEGSIEGIGDSNAVVVLRIARHPRVVLLDGKPIATRSYDPDHHLLSLRFPNSARPQTITVTF